MLWDYEILAFFLEELRESQASRGFCAWALQPFRPIPTLGVMYLDFNWAEATKQPLSPR